MDFKEDKIKLPDQEEKLNNFNVPKIFNSNINKKYAEEEKKEENLIFKVQINEKSKFSEVNPQLNSINKNSQENQNSLYIKNKIIKENSPNESDGFCLLRDEDY